MTTRTTFTVPDIHCGHCKESIEGALGDLSGVEEVSVAIEPRTVDVTFDTSRVDLGQITATIEALGYEVPEQN